MSNRFQRRTARNTRQLVRIAAWDAARAEQARRIELRWIAAQTKLALEARVPPRPDLDGEPERRLGSAAVLPRAGTTGRRETR